MQLSPLQSRLAASLGASLVIFAIYLLLFSPSLASATELPVHPVVRVEQPLESSGPFDISYEPDFEAFDRSLIGRAESEIRPLSNNGAVTSNVDPGTVECFVLEKSAIFDDDDDESTTSKTVYISANTCLLPALSRSKNKTALAEQLTLYVSTSSEEQCPSTAADLSKMKLIDFEEGAAMYSLNATGTIYLGVSAPNITQDYANTYNFELAASVDQYYHQYNPHNDQLLWMDSDSNSVLLVTKNLTDSTNSSETLMHQNLPYDIFIQNNDSDSINGLKHSYCGLVNSAQLWGSSTGTGKADEQISMGFTTRGPGGFARQQFYLQGLNSSSLYSAILVQTHNTTNSSTSSKTKRAGSIVGTGGVVFNATSFPTSGGTNCKVVTDLEFCNETQYAVPGNDKKFNNSALAKVYDDYAKSMYANFEKVLMQIPCEAPPQSSYSLVRDCDDCKSAYKRWLCTVAIPRCEDVSGNSTASIFRNVNQPFPNGTWLDEAQRTLLGQTPAFNASRNAFIDTTIKPGPYKELLPCEDLCYELVQSCPSAMGLSCPQPGSPSFNVSYGQRKRNSPVVTCNYPGEARTQTSMAAAIVPSALILSFLPLMMWMGL